MKLKALIILALTLAAELSLGQSAQPLEAKIRDILDRPAYRHALFGIEIFSTTDNKMLYALNADKLFVPGSVTKLVTVGTTMELLGSDFRYRTAVYRTGPTTKDGVLQGDLVLVASGDPNLSNRVTPNDTLAFENADHAYGHVMEAKLVAGDPLRVIRDLAVQTAKHGIRRINGRVLVDVSLFPEGAKEGGSGVVISPVAVNDNVIDVIVTPGKAAGAPAEIKAVPATKYAKFVSEVKTAATGSEPEVGFVPAKGADGTLTVKVAGTVPAGTAARPFPFAVPEPSKFAEVVLSEALEEAGVQLGTVASAGAIEWKAVAENYKPENKVAEHVSPPLREDVKVTLKVSQNLHAAMMPYILGAVIAKQHDEALESGLQAERKFLEQNHFDLTAAAQSDGAGANAFFTPDFMVKFLEFMAKQKDSRYFYEALPVLGRDGTLWETQRNSPAAGKLHGKTGTNVSGDLLNEQYMVNGKGLAGYLETRSGKRVVFAIFANHLPVAPNMAAVSAVGDALAEIIAAAYEQ